MPALPRFAAPLLLALAAAAQPPAQAPTPVPSTIPTLRVTATLVQVDAVVTNSSGAHVMGLAQSDFEILQDGHPQPLTFFTRVDGPLRQPPPPPPVKGQVAPPPVTVAPLTSAADVKRTIALVVDDLALSYQNLVRTRTALTRYVDQRMQPGDLVAIIRTGGGLAILEQFTSDKRLLTEAIASLKWRFSGRQGLMAIRPKQDPANPAPPSRSANPELLDYQYSLSALGALGTVEQVITGMRRFPGRKSIVFLSDNLRVDGSINSAIDRLTDLANRSMVSLYAVDPGGLRTHRDDLAVEEAVASRDPASLDRLPTLRGADTSADDDEFGRQAGLEALASRTGGLFFGSRNDIESCIAEAADDQNGYYVLGFSPAEGSFTDSGAPKFHRIQVRLLNRPGLKVRWKSGFNGTPDQLPPSDGLTSTRTRERQLLDALASPFAANGLRVRLTSTFMQTKDHGPIVQSLLHFGASELAFTHEPDGTWHASVDVVWSAYRGMRNPIAQGEKPQEIRLNEEAYRKSLREGFLLPLAHRATFTGTFLMRVVVRDSLSQRIGSASQYVDVPDTAKGKFAISGISVRLASKENLAAIGAPIGLNGVEWTAGGPSTRRYLQGQALVYGFQIINPKPKGAAKALAVTSYVRVYRDGQLIYTGPVTRPTTPSVAGDGTIIGAGVLRLGVALSPGEYLLQVVVKDENGRKKDPPLTQWIDFEVTTG